MTFLHSRNNSQVNFSPKEMLEISQEISREFAPGALINEPESTSKSKFSPKEMFEISEKIRQDFAPRASSNTQELVLLPVDPEHLYAYWNLGVDKPNTTPKNDSVSQLTLRIYSEENKRTDITKTKSWLDVAIDSVQTQQSVFISMRVQETPYQATIGKRFQDSSFAPFVYSNSTHVQFGKPILHQLKKSTIEVEPVPHCITANREISTYMISSASGRGNIQ